ncbi:MAG: sigma-70 family RNA polymerase sigma factor [Verrucomicrobiales bacterium]|nr:sigma-70 family RNA polymerase sigma factor [Verrucomicrobiales bacterium]
MRRPGPVGGGFCTTHWSVVGRAKADSPEGRRALQELCEAYYQPVETFFRCQVVPREQATDLAHDFFAGLLAGGAIAAAAPERGRFRSYLLGAARHFLSHQRERERRLKRGGGVELISSDQPAEGGEGEATTGEVLPDPEAVSPAAEFDREWALTVLGRALEVLRRENVEQGRGEFFEHAKPWLTGDASRGDQASLAVSLGMNPNAFKVAVHRLKQRFRELLKAEIASTLSDPRMLDEEMRSLFAALGGS